MKELTKGPHIFAGYLADFREAEGKQHIRRLYHQINVNWMICGIQGRLVQPSEYASVKTKKNEEVFRQ